MSSQPKWLKGPRIEKSADLLELGFSYDHMTNGQTFDYEIAKPIRSWKKHLLQDKLALQVCTIVRGQEAGKYFWYRFNFKLSPFPIKWTQ